MPIYLIEVWNRDTHEWNPSHLVPPFRTPALACESLKFLTESDPGSLRRIRAYSPMDPPVLHVTLKGCSDEPHSIALLRKGDHDA